MVKKNTKKIHCLQLGKLKPQQLNFKNSKYKINSKFYNTFRSAKRPSLGRNYARKRYEVKDLVEFHVYLFFLIIRFFP